MFENITSNQILIAVLLILIVIVLYRIKYEKFDKNYLGVPLVDSVNDSGADLRFATQFTSTDEDPEKFANFLQKGTSASNALRNLQKNIIKK